MDLSSASLTVLVLLSARVGGLMLVAPIFSSKQVPTKIKVGLIVLLAILLQPVAHGALAVDPVLTPATFLTELVTGFGIGLGAAIIVGAAEFAGDLMGVQIGLSGAAVLDPTNGSSQNVLGQFTSLFAATLLLAVNGHLVMIDALARSFRVVPVGAEMHAAGLWPMARDGATLFALGLQFAAPVVAMVLVGHTALAVLSRAAPQLNVLSVAFPIHIGVGLFALAASVPILGAFFNGWESGYATTLTGYLVPLAHGAAR